MCERRANENNGCNTMVELLLKSERQNAATKIARFSVKEICAIVSDMSTAADKHEAKTKTVLAMDKIKTQSESMRLNLRLQELLVKVADKNKPAFEQFYDDTIKLCFSQAFRITKKQDIAEEVVSNVYMQVWRQAASYDGSRSAVMTWLMMLCRSRALDALRQHKNRQIKESVDIDTTAEPFTDETPQDILHVVQQNSFLHNAIAQLKPQQRQLLSLAYFRGLTHDEIANHTKIPLGTVKTQIRRAIILLRKLMCEQESCVDDKACGGESYEEKK